MILSARLIRFLRGLAPKLNPTIAKLPAMSKSMFANPKAALGFAGVTLAIAVAASFAASAYLPGTAEQEEVVAETEVTAPAAAPAAPASQVAWADEGFTDDWNESAVDTANGFDSGSPAAETGQPAFGDYAPSEVTQPEPRENAPVRARPAQTSGPQIRSGAAPGVAPARAPGSNGPGSLEIAE
jgi:hypothetical protein